MGFTLLKLSPSCISEIIMVLLRIISGISLLPSLIGFLCAYCISPGYSMDGPLDHYPAYELLAGFGYLPRLHSLCGLLGFPRYSTGFAGERSFAPGILWVLWHLRGFFLGILWVATAIGSLGHSMAQISFLRLRVTLLSAR